MTKKCLYEGCTRSTYNGGRGLCPHHLVKYSREVKKGSTSWEQLEMEGKVKRKLTQVEKNINQAHEHKSYRQRKKVLI